MHRNGPPTFGLVDVHVTIGQLLQIAVEIQPDNLRVAIDDRAAGVPADDVRRVHTIEGRGQVQLVFALDPARWQVKRRLVVVLRRSPVETVEGRFKGNGLADDILNLFLLLRKALLDRVQAKVRPRFETMLSSTTPG